jgi:Zn-finger nucleic acid-binding protein
MRSYERSGVTVDQCAECRGIFLDRGELERLVDAEQSWHATEQPPREPPYQPPSYGGRGYGEHSQRRRKKSFFDELFD